MNANDAGVPETMHLYISMRSRKGYDLFFGPKQKQTYQRKVRFIFRTQNPQKGTIIRLLLVCSANTPSLRKQTSSRHALRIVFVRNTKNLYRNAPLYEQMSNVSAPYRYGGLVQFSARVRLFVTCQSFGCLRLKKKDQAKWVQHNFRALFKR